MHPRFIAGEITRTKVRSAGGLGQSWRNSAALVSSHCLSLLIFYAQIMGNLILHVNSHVFVSLLGLIHSPFVTLHVS